MRIDVFKYEFPLGTSSTDINFFSEVEPAELDIMDLYEFYIKGTMSNISYKMHDIDEKDNSQFVKASGFQFDVIADIHTGDNLYEFCEMYSDSDRFQWKVICYDDNGQAFYWGMIYKNGFESPERESNIITVKVIGYEKEFAKYYSNATLPGTDQIPHTTTPVDLSFLTGLTFSTFQDTLRTVFPNIPLALDNDHFTAKFYVVDRPYFYSPTLYFGNGSVNIRAGYDSFVLMNTDRFTWFDSLCQCYGWKWFFFANKLYIQNLADDSFPDFPVDRDDFVSHGLASEALQYHVDHVIIEDGGYFSEQPEDDFRRTLNIQSTTEGRLYLGGERKVIYSNTNDYFSHLQPFTYLVFRQGPTPNMGSYVYYQDGWFTVFTVQDWPDVFRVKKLEMHATILTPDFETTDRFLNYRKKNSITLKALVCEEQYGGTLNVTLARETSNTFYGNGNTYRANHDVGTDGFWFTGSVGHNLIYYDETRDPAGFLTYEYYIETEQWKNNMRCNTSTINQNIIKVQAFGDCKNPLITPVLTNYDEANLEGIRFFLQELAFHPIDNTYEMTLIA